MAFTSTVVRLSAEERGVLEGNVRAAKTEQRLAFRSRVVCLAADGMGTNAIAAQLRVSPATVSKWRLRFAREGLSGLADAPRSGAPGRYGKKTERRILAKLDEPVPEGETVWTARLLARALGDVSEDHVWRVLARHGIHLQRRRSWCVSTDPEFAAKAADIVGLYLAPPENALVICVDEKPQVQALERAQGYLRFSDGQTCMGFSDRYRRNGTTTLFGALEVASGLVSTGHYKRRRRLEFLDFMNRLVGQYPADQEIHVILDNLSTHTKKGGTWLARHPHVHFHFTPTNASWLNQIEVWFGILTRRVLRSGSFASARDLRGAIDRFTSAWCADCSPFAWTKEAVQQVTLKRRYSDLCK
jgi:transposase